MFTMLGFILPVLPAGLRLLSLCGRLGLVPEQWPQTQPDAPRVGWRGAERRPQGSHLGKSGWRPGHCAGPSSHWGGCWPSPAGSTAWFGRPGRAGARGQDASGSGSRGLGHHRASARLRGTRARRELSPSLRFRGTVPAPGRGRGEDTGHPLGGPSPTPPRPPPRPALRLVGRAGPGSEARGWGRRPPSAACRRGPETIAPLTRGAQLRQAVATRSPPPRSSKPGAHPCGPRGRPRLCTRLRPARARTPEAQLNRGEGGMSESGRKGHPVAGTRVSASNY